MQEALQQGEPVHVRRLEPGRGSKCGAAAHGTWSVDWLEEQLQGYHEWSAFEQTASQDSSDSAVRHYLFPHVSTTDSDTWAHEDAKGSMREVRGSSLRALLSGHPTTTELAAAHPPARYFRQCLSQPHELPSAGDCAAISWRHASGVQPSLQAAIEGLDWTGLHATLSAATDTGFGVRVRSVQVFA